MQIKPVVFDDALTLLNLGREAFFEAFAHLNHTEDMEAYAAKAFTLQKIKAELIDPGSFFYFAMLADIVAGYLKINLDASQTEEYHINALEVERIYVLKQYQGQQIGKKLLNFAIEKAIAHKRDQIWLGVWEHNFKAIGFYQNEGFETFGSHQFMLGNDEQTDLLMRKALN